MGAVEWAWGWAPGNHSQDFLASPLAPSGRWGARGYWRACTGTPGVGNGEGVGRDRGTLLSCCLDAGTWSQALPRPSRLPLPSRACDGALQCPARPPLPPRPLGTPEAGVSLRILSATHTGTSPEETAPSSQGQASSTGAGVSH